MSRYIFSRNCVEFSISCNFYMVRIMQLHLLCGACAVNLNNVFPCVMSDGLCLDVLKCLFCPWRL